MLHQGEMGTMVFSSSVDSSLSGVLLTFLYAEFRASLVSGEVGFAELASKESDCGSAKRGGDLGLFGRGQMQSELSRAHQWIILRAVLAE